MIPNFDWTMIIVIVSTVLATSIIMPYLLLFISKKHFAEIVNNSEDNENKYKFSYKDFYLFSLKVCLSFSLFLILPLSLMDYFKQKDFYECKKQDKEMVYINKNYQCINKDLAKKYTETLKDIAHEAK